MDQVEQTLRGIFANRAPSLPKRAKELLVRCAPWLSLLAGTLSAWAAWNMWHWAYIVTSHATYANQLNQVVNDTTLTVSRLNFGVWLGILLLVVQTALLLWALPGLFGRKKAGWDRVCYAVLVSVAYGVIVAFTSYGGLGMLFWILVGAVMSFYVLFQVRSYYLHRATADSTRPNSSQTS